MYKYGHLFTVLASSPVRGANLNLIKNYMPTNDGQDVSKDINLAINFLKKDLEDYKASANFKINLLLDLLAKRDKRITTIEGAISNLKSKLQEGNNV